MIENIICFTLVVVAIVFVLLYCNAEVERERLEKVINRTLTNSTRYAQAQEKFINRTLPNSNRYAQAQK
jgi:tRNA A37 N6-isopentenylltransferase MiaA